MYQLCNQWSPCLLLRLAALGRGKRGRRKGKCRLCPNYDPFTRDQHQRQLSDLKSPRQRGRLKEHEAPKLKSHLSLGPQGTRTQEVLSEKHVDHQLRMVRFIASSSTPRERKREASAEGARKWVNKESRRGSVELCCQ